MRYEEIPSYQECVAEATFDDGGPHSVPDGVARLVAKFTGKCSRVRLGRTSYCTAPALPVFLRSSIVVTFRMSPGIHTAVKAGDLPGPPEDAPYAPAQYHAVLVESYDFKKKLFHANNSWGGDDASYRFTFQFKMFSEYWVTEIDSDPPAGLPDPTNVRVLKFGGTDILCAEMCLDTALYSREYICFPNAAQSSVILALTSRAAEPNSRAPGQPEGETSFFGYNLEQYIAYRENHGGAAPRQEDGTEPEAS
jgi:hypothetical protein